jgi:hypothetical protein
MVSFSVGSASMRRALLCVALLACLAPAEAAARYK